MNEHIKGLYETHLPVANLQHSIEFYKNTLGLEQCAYQDSRKLAFFWIGQPQEYMLGIWETPVENIRPLHFAFRCEKEFILKESAQWLKKRGLQPFNFLKDGTDEPMVFAWMPAISVYFNDPDGHILEFIAVLEEKPLPEMGVLSYKEWKKINLFS